MENKIPCGGFYFDPSQIKFTMIDGKPTMQIVVTTTGGDTLVGHFYPTTEDGKATMDLDLNAHNIKNAGGISTNGAHPIHFGATVLPQGTAGVKLTSTNKDELAIVEPDGIDKYAPVHVGTPTVGTHASTRLFVEESIDAATSALEHDIELLKAKITELAKNHPKS